MTVQIKEVLKNLAELNKKVSVLDSEICGMEDRRDETSKKLNDAVTAIESAQSAVNCAASDFARGKGTDSEITKAQTALAGLQIKKTALDAGLEALAAAIEDVQAERQTLKDETGNLNDRLWEAVYNLEMIKVEAAVMRLISAQSQTSFEAQRSGGLSALRNNLTSMTHEKPDSNVIKGLLKEYGIAA